MKREYRTPHSPIGNTRESNVTVTRPKTAHYDVYTLIKIGIDRQGLLTYTSAPMSSRNPP